MSCPAPPATLARVAFAPEASFATGCGWTSQLNLPGRCTISVPVARSISRPWLSASVCRKLVRSVCRSSRYLSRGVGAELAGAVAAAGADDATAAAGLPVAAGPAVVASRAVITSTGKLRGSTSVLRRRRREHVPRAIRLPRADEPGELHRLQPPPRAVGTDLQASLHVGNGGFTLGGDDAHRLVVERIGFRVLAAVAALAFLTGEAGNRR